MWANRITSDPNVMMGKPVIKGTRITVEHLLRKLAMREPISAILAAHPHITSDDIYAAAAYAADYMAQGETLSIPTQQQ